jgi:hypothetical protein
MNKILCELTSIFVPINEFHTFLDGRAERVLAVIPYISHFIQMIMTHIFIALIIDLALSEYVGEG